MKKKALFIDRDGTIIREPEDEQIDSLEKLSFVPGAISGLKSLMNRGYELVMVSNQDGLGTPSFPEETFWPAHLKMLETLEGEGVKWDEVLIDRSFPADNAPTRKPRTGMLTRYLDGSYDMDACYVIGDRDTDMQLAANLGCKGLRISDAGSWDDAVREILGRNRRARVSRRTAETDITVEVDLDASGESKIDTGLKFLDHMLMQLPHHGGFTLNISCKGDLEVDEHHTMEDVALALGQALDTALGDKRGIERYGFVLPMDESRAMVLLDLGGRAETVWQVEFTREYVGDVPTEMFHHFFKSLATALRANIHVQASGENNHHLAEGIFKALARALKSAVRRDPFSWSLPSSKGTL